MCVAAVSEAIRRENQYMARALLDAALSYLLEAIQEVRRGRQEANEVDG